MSIFWEIPLMWMPEPIDYKPTFSKLKKKSSKSFIVTQQIHIQVKQENEKRHIIYNSAFSIGSGNGLVPPGNKPLPSGANVETDLVSKCRAHCFPLPDGPGQVKLPVGQVDLNRFFFLISHKQIEKFQNSWSRASDDFEQRQALHMASLGHNELTCFIYFFRFLGQVLSLLLVKDWLNIFC